ncbi:hypothetical protein H6F89_30590 [Cyanobacteria bacterium FACHB-63]|nr:hypothetical protein [Cyanobacteria bacterium FACHB-63]
MFTTLSLVFLSYCVAFCCAFGLPILLSKILPADASEATKLYIQLFLGAVVTVFFLWMSWDTVDAMVGSAIRADVSVTEKRLSKELEQYKAENSEKEHIKRQNLEFTSVVLSDLSSEIVDGLEPYSDKALRQAFRRRVARDSIIRELAYNDALLKKIATEATKMTLKTAKMSGEEASQDEVILIFRQDIYIYLKAWFMCSILNDREMNVVVIKQRCQGKQAQYISALTYIKQDLIKKRQVVERFETEYKSDIIQMLEEYLNKLIAALQQAYRKMDVR